MKKRASLLKITLIHLVFDFLIIYFGLGIILFLFQRSYIYHPNDQNFNSCEEFKDAKKVNFNGTRFYYKNISRKLFVFYHGNAGSACDRSFLKDIIEQNGYSYIFVEYAGYSGDSRRPTEELLLRDAVNVRDFASNLDYDELALAGESIGTGLASYHSTIEKADKILLIAPFTDLASVAQKKYFFYPVRWILKDNFNNKSYLSNYKGKLCILHGDEDNIIPASLSKNLFDRVLTTDKKYNLIKKAGHNDIYDFPGTWDNISNFLK